MKLPLCFLAIFFVLCFGCSQTTSGRGPQGIATTGNPGTTGTTETGVAAPSGTQGTVTTTPPGSVIPKENSGSAGSNGVIESERDQQITDTVKQKLEIAGFLSPYQLEISTEKGVVSIYGKVPDKATADSIVAKAKEVDGVKDVHSTMEISK